MPTDDDRASVSIHFEGEARRLRIRRPRLGGDGLFFFGRRCAAQSVTLTADEVGRLRRGRVVAVDVVGEHVIYLQPPETCGDNGERSQRAAPIYGVRTAANARRLG